MEFESCQEFLIAVSLGEHELFNELESEGTSALVGQRAGQGAEPCAGFSRRKISFWTNICITFGLAQSL